MRFSATILLGVCAFGLNACFESKLPLIAESESSTPVAPGLYLSSDSSDAGEQFKVSVDGKATNVTELKSDGKSEVSSYLMRSIRDGYFVVMDRSDFRYGLIKIDHRQVISYDGSFIDHCTQLEELAFSRDLPLSKFGVAGLDGTTCYFSSFSGLAKAFDALIDADKMAVATTYTPKANTASRKTGQDSASDSSSSMERMRVAFDQLGLQNVTVENLIKFIRANAARPQDDKATPAN